jgi:hypothetical protein
MREFKFFRGYTIGLIVWNDNANTTTINPNYITTYTPGTTGTYTIPIGQTYPNTGTILTTSHGTTGTITTTGTHFLNTSSSTTFL